MQQHNSAKQNIIDVTMALIEQSNGNISSITTRAIAEKAGVGIGLINYHFQTKENLIEICVQQMISQVIGNFHINNHNQMSAKERLEYAMRGVFEFILKNPSLSSISILGDLTSPKINDNTMKSAMGFLQSLKDTPFTEQQKFLLSFMIGSFIQNIFIRREMTKELFGFDLLDQNQREEMIHFVVHQIL